MGDQKKTGSILPPYNEDDFITTSPSKTAGSPPKGLILVKEQRTLIHADSTLEELYHYSVPEQRKTDCPPKMKPSTSSGNVAVKTKNKSN